jgi:hypothetical protein
VRNALVNAALTLAAVALLSELLARVYRFGVTSLWPPTMDSIREFGRSGLIRASPDLELQYELVPKLDRFPNAKAHFTTNSAGLRDREYPLARIGTPICLAYLNYWSRGYEEIIAAFRTAARRNDLAFVDVSAAFPPDPDTPRYGLYRADGQPNAAANEAFADVLLGWLLGSGLIPPPGG